MTSGNHWTLERELKKLGASEDLRLALVRLNLLRRGTDEVSLVAGGQGWVRSGAETYIFRFSLSTPDYELALVLKACVAFAPASSIERILSQWVARRQLLEAHGASTPRLYYAGHGLVLEEEIPFSFKEALLAHKREQAEELLVRAAELAGLVSGAGFSPLRLFDDLRSRGKDVVIVDFGEDLGEPHVTGRANPQLFLDLLQELRTWGIAPNRLLWERLYSVYERKRIGPN